MGKQRLRECSGLAPRQKSSGFCKWSKESSGFGRNMGVELQNSSARTKASINCRIKSREWVKAEGAEDTQHLVPFTLRLY